MEGSGLHTNRMHPTSITRVVSDYSTHTFLLFSTYLQGKGPRKGIFRLLFAFWLNVAPFEDSPFIRKALSFSFRSEQRREIKCDYSGIVISELVRWDVYTEVQV